MTDRAPEEREAQLAKFRGAAPGLSGRLAGERADAIPEAAVRAFMDGADPEGNLLDYASKQWIADGLNAAARFLRAAHPEAGRYARRRAGQEERDRAREDER